VRRLELDGHAVAHGDDDIGEGFWIGDASADAHELFGGASRHAAGGHFLILALQRLVHLHRAHVVGAHGIRIHDHLDLAPVAAVHVRAANALDGLEANGYDFIREIGELANAALRRTAWRST
jgi:hypothetical protein